MKKRNTPNAMTRSELAASFGLSYSTLYRRLKPMKDQLNLQDGILLTPKQVKLICIALAFPIPEGYEQVEVRKR